MTRTTVTYASRKRTYSETIESVPSLSASSPATPGLDSASPCSSSGSSSGSSNINFNEDEPQTPRCDTPTTKPQVRESEDKEADARASTTARPPPVKKPKLTQTIIDLGTDSRKRCKDCNMEYIPSNSEDAKFHREFHAASMGGVDVPVGLTSSARIVSQPRRRIPKPKSSDLCTSRGRPIARPSDAVVEIAAKDKPVVRKWAKRVLQTVERELGAAETTEEVLWATNGEDGAAAHADADADRMRCYLYLSGKKCVGFCLAERINAAGKVEGGMLDKIELSKDDRQTSATMGISRIWVSREYRRLGIATELLRCVEAKRWNARGSHVKACMAFSQPTESGDQLARAWFRQGNPVRIYDEGARLDPAAG